MTLASRAAVTSDAVAGSGQRTGGANVSAWSAAKAVRVWTSGGTGANAKKGPGSPSKGWHMVCCTSEPGRREAP